jgi:hypothetical protein
MSHWDALEHPEVVKMITTQATKVSGSLPSIHDADDLWMQTAEAIGSGKFGDVLARVESDPGILYGDIREYMIDFVKYESKHFRQNESYEARYLDGAYE